MSSGGPQRFVLGTVVSTDESDNEAGCSPRVSPDNGTATDSPTPFTLTFACTRPGVSHVLLTVHPEGSDPISLRWSKHHGNALDVGTSWEGEDVVSVGVARPSYAPDKPTAVRNAYIKSDTFYLRLDPDQLNVTKEEAFNAEHGHAISASCSPSTVCGPSVSGNATQTYMLKKGPVLALSLDYNCKAADGVATVSLDIQMNPFAPVSFSLLKYCQNMRGFFVSSEGASHDVVRFGDVQPSWVPPENQSLPVHRYSAAGDGPHGATLTFTLQATVQKVKFDKPVVDVKSPYSPGNPVCTVEPSGSAAKGGTLEKDSEAALSLDVDCGDNSGYVVVNVTIGLPPYRTVQWTFAKFHGTRPGFDVVATMPLPSGPYRTPLQPRLRDSRTLCDRRRRCPFARHPERRLRVQLAAPRPQRRLRPRLRAPHLHVPGRRRACRMRQPQCSLPVLTTALAWPTAGPPPARAGQHHHLHGGAVGGQGGLRPRVLRPRVPPRRGGRRHRPALRRPLLVQVRSPDDAAHLHLHHRRRPVPVAALRLPEGGVLAGTPTPPGATLADARCRWCSPTASSWAPARRAPTCSATATPWARGSTRRRSPRWWPRTRRSAHSTSISTAQVRPHAALAMGVALTDRVWPAPQTRRSPTSTSTGRPPWWPTRAATARPT